MKILSLDMGKFKTVWLIYLSGGAGAQQYGKIVTAPREIHDLLIEHRPERLVLESGPSAGWVCDIAATLGIATQVANTNDERWHWKRNKKKTDRIDALKIAQMSELGCLPTVHVPTAQMRQWRGQLHEELEQLDSLEKNVAKVEEKLDELAAADPRIKRLRTAPCVGPRTAELVLTALDDAKRFKTSRQVGAYAGLSPRQWQSGQSLREGHISRMGNPLLREVLVEICWLGTRTHPWMKQVYEDVRRGSDKRKKIAITALARRMFVRLWAMLRDDADWKEPAVRGASPAAPA